MDIKSIFGDVLFSCEAVTICEAAEAAVRGRINLTGARLSYADLTGARLAYADLTGADLTGINLTGASLRDADLSGVRLAYADLTGADLTGINLSGASLRSADLSGVNLSGINLSDADLTGADLSGAILTGTRLDTIRDDLFAVLAGAPAEVSGLLTALREGRVDGSTYEGECACLVGTIANLAHVDYDDLPNIWPDSSRPIERFFIGIKRGDTPATNAVSRIVDGWIVEWQAANP